jgi:hypothetical protein
MMYNQQFGSFIQRYALRFFVGLAISLVGQSTQAQQSFSFSFGSSSSFSSGNKPNDEYKSPGDDKSTEYPSTARNGWSSGMSKSITNVNGHTVEKSHEDRDGKFVSTTRVKNGKQDVFIEESEDIGIRVTIKETVRGKERKTEFKADSRKELKKKHPAAFDWVRKFASDQNKFNATAGNAGLTTGQDAQKMMKQQIEEMIQQTEDPTLKQQLRAMIEQMNAEGNK